MSIKDRKLIFCSEGTLLGVYRDKSLICHDHDVDMYC